ncbi:MAG: hypothetical protein EZS28_007381 [Streblomastix strix]|uniref:Uncharacterized protein n=1 Tax=Streblomastix strix TaxID=222440 RepID=A0A5J4WQ31_9EUKA|nr:MAG: hypothetical protein EZS28_007381 [Streblomastix strix]
MVVKEMVTESETVEQIIAIQLKAALIAQTSIIDPNLQSASNEDLHYATNSVIICGLCLIVMKLYEIPGLLRNAINQIYYPQGVSFPGTGYIQWTEAFNIGSASFQNTTLSIVPTSFKTSPVNWDELSRLLGG